MERISLISGAYDFVQCVLQEGFVFNLGYDSDKQSNGLCPMSHSLSFNSFASRTQNTVFAHRIQEHVHHWCSPLCFNNNGFHRQKLEKANWIFKWSSRNSWFNWKELFCSQYLWWVKYLFLPTLNFNTSYLLDCVLLLFPFINLIPVSDAHLQSVVRCSLVNIPFTRGRLAHLNSLLASVIFSLQTTLRGIHQPCSHNLSTSYYNQIVFPAW